MEPRKEFTLKYFVEPSWSRGNQRKWFGFRHYMYRVMGPYLLSRFGVLPLLPPLLLPPLLLPFLVLPNAATTITTTTRGVAGVGTFAFASAAAARGSPVGVTAMTTLWRNSLLNLLIAEVLTNVHSFVMIMPNHCGRDLYQFHNRSCVPNSGTFYLRQVLSVLLCYATSTVVCLHLRCFRFFIFFCVSLLLLLLVIFLILSPLFLKHKLKHPTNARPAAPRTLATCIGGVKCELSNGRRPQRLHAWVAQLRHRAPSHAPGTLRGCTVG